MRISILAIPLLAGCPISAETAGDRWTDWVLEHNQCDVAEDCVVISPGCPLGCATAIASEHEAEALEVSADLVSAFERGGRSCAYDCIQPPPVACDSGACVFEE